MCSRRTTTFPISGRNSPDGLKTKLRIICLCAIVHSVSSSHASFQDQMVRAVCPARTHRGRRLAGGNRPAEIGLIDADLGGGLIKQRVARQGKGRSGGYRAVIAYRTGRRAVFIFGLAKSDRENFTEKDLETARDIGRIWIPAPDEQIACGIRDGQLIEVPYDKEA
jgi:hypothetical protein